MQVAQSTALRLQIKLTWFEEIFEEYYFLFKLIHPNCAILNLVHSLRLELI